MARNLISWPALFASPDEKAMWRVRTDDDAEAFAELVARWHGPIQGLCTRMTGDSHRGEDLAQDTFTRLFASRKNYEPTGKFSTFVWRIALNICYDELRKINRRGELSLDQRDEVQPAPDFAAHEPGPDQLLVQHERAHAVRNALLQLSEPYRVVVVLRHYEGLKFREIGVVLGIPEGTVKSRMCEALSQLGRLLSPALADPPTVQPETPSPSVTPSEMQSEMSSRPPERLLI